MIMIVTPDLLRRRPIALDSSLVKDKTRGFLPERAIREENDRKPRCADDGGGRRRKMRKWRPRGARDGRERIIFCLIFFTLHWPACGDNLRKLVNDCQSIHNTKVEKLRWICVAVLFISRFSFAFFRRRLLRPSSPSAPSPG